MAGLSCFTVILLSTMSLSSTIPVSLRLLASFVVGGAFGSRVVQKRMRVGRLPLPQQVTDLTPEDEPALADVNTYVDRLAELPLDQWLAIGRSVIERGSSAEPEATAFVILEATLADQGLDIAAWYARDAVETSAFFVARSAAGWTKHDRRVFAAAHAAAETAALALLARDKLSGTDLSLLIGPFAPLVLAAS